MIFFCYFIFFAGIFFDSLSQNVNLHGKINGFTHNWDCCSDGNPFDCFLISNRPDPRYKVWSGYNNSNFTISSSATGLISGCTNTYGANSDDCSLWNPGIINLPDKTNVNANTYSIRLQSWEEEYGHPLSCGSDCESDYCEVCFIFCVETNSDDVRCGPNTVADISYWLQPPCTDYTYYGEGSSGSFLSQTNRCSMDNGGGYGINQLIVNWDFASAPTITLQPDDPSFGGNNIITCNNSGYNLQFNTNTFHGWTLGRFVKWQQSLDNINWTDVTSPNVTPYTTQNIFTYTIPNLTPGTYYYRALASSKCSSPNFTTLTTTTNSVKVIIKDGTTDPFCTAPICNTAFIDLVNGNDITGNGSPTTPYKSLSRGISSGKLQFRITSGVGIENNIINIPNNAEIEGSYIRSGTYGEIWKKTSSPSSRTSITFSGFETFGLNIKHNVAFKADATIGWSINDIDITTVNSSGTAGDGSGCSNYGLLLINGANGKISRCTINTGNASKGADGTTPPDGGGSDGGDKGLGKGGCSNSCSNCNSTAGTNGGDGKGIGSVAPLAANRGTSVSSGVSGCNNAGRSGNNGTIGNAGKTGVSGINGTSFTYGTYFTPGSKGSTGGPGGGGQGGGGGSGNAVGGAGTWCGFAGVCVSCGAHSGGDGGIGGKGGSGGTGGNGGGASIAIYTSGASTISYEDIVVNSGILGAGGSGALGSNGLPGDDGIAGSCNSCVAGSRCGGNGGKGGSGGKGGKGGDGLSGVSYQSVLNGVPTILSTSIPYPVDVVIDYSIDRNGINGKVCKNSIIDISAVTPGIVLWNVSSSSYIDTMGTLASGSNCCYTNTSNPTKLSTNTIGNHSVEINGTNLKDFLYVSDDNRLLPTYNSSKYEICKGGFVSPIISNSYDVSNIQQREWLVYDSTLASSTPVTPLFSATSSAPTFGPFNSIGTYIIRYKERHNCCGWSVPVFSKVVVTPLPTMDTIIPLPNTSNVCFGNGVSATFVKGVDGATCNILYEYQIDGSGSWLPYTSGSIIGLSANISIAVRASKGCGGSGCGSIIINQREWSVLKPLASAVVVDYDCTDPDNPFKLLNGTPSGVFTDTWSKVSGAGTILNPTLSSTLITGLSPLGSPTIVKYLVKTPLAGCKDSAQYTITPTVLDLTKVSKYSDTYYCKLCPISDGKTYKYYDDNGKIMVKIEDPYGNGQLDNTEVCIDLYYNPIATPTSSIVPSVLTNFGDQQPYLPRRWSISSQTDPLQVTKVTLYFTNDEYLALKAKAASTLYSFNNVNDLAVVKYSGGNSGTFTAPGGSGGLGSLMSSTFQNYGGDWEVSFEVANFSTFYIYPPYASGWLLPVELISFTGYYSDLKNHLNWVTASELNTERFEIEKSIDGMNFNKIGSIKATGNSSSLINYEFIDLYPSVGSNYYRLKIVDIGEIFSYSEIVNINVDEPVLSHTIGVYPNPTSGQINISHQSIRDNNLNINIFDNTGRLISSYSSKVFKGITTIPINLEMLSNGVYIINTIDEDGSVSNLRFVKE